MASKSLAICHEISGQKREPPGMDWFCELLVPKPGVELGYPYGRWYLKPVRLPVPPLRLEGWGRELSPINSDPSRRVQGNIPRSDIPPGSVSCRLQYPRDPPGQPPAHRHSTRCVRGLSPRLLIDAKPVCGELHPRSAHRIALFEIEDQPLLGPPW